MSEQLLKFLVDLACDHDRITRFVADPASELAGANLSPEETSLLVARDPVALAAALSSSVADLMTRIPLMPSRELVRSKAGPKKPGGKKTSVKKASGKKKAATRKPSARRSQKK